ncbi:hypothetical protein ON010_g3935 [Phytophthora cinnamomi]|nr:hypothetical protein ON010_g3935 [Phytophthora cinnamomi]
MATPVQQHFPLAKEERDDCAFTRPRRSENHNVRIGVDVGVAVVYGTRQICLHLVEKSQSTAQDVFSGGIRRLLLFERHSYDVLFKFLAVHGFFVERIQNECLAGNGNL